MKPIQVRGRDQIKVTHKQHIRDPIRGDHMHNRGNQGNVNWGGKYKPTIINGIPVTSASVPLRIGSHLQELKLQGSVNEDPDPLA